jgi:hypothetical protein
MCSAEGTEEDWETFIQVASFSQNLNKIDTVYPHISDVFKLQNFAHTEIIKYDPDIHNTDFQFTITKIWNTC